MFQEKRQIFREQVLPELGGKIPEEAFTAERLKLNRLDKEGFTIPDGVLEARYPHIIHPYHRQSSKNEILKVIVIEHLNNLVLYKAPQVEMEKATFDVCYAFHESAIYCYWINRALFRQS